MSKQAHRAVQIPERRTVTEAYLTEALDASEEAFWARAYEYFPEVKSGDTEPGATVFYKEVVRNFMTHWLANNARIRVGSGTNADEAEALLAGAISIQTTWTERNGRYAIHVNDTDETVSAEVVELRMGDTSHGFAVEVRDVSGEGIDYAVDEWEIDGAISQAVKAIEQRREQ